MKILSCVLVILFSSNIVVGQPAIHGDMNDISADSTLKILYEYSEKLAIEMESWIPEELKQFKEALKQSEIALELYPAQPILYLLNGVSNINLSVPKKAIDSLETGLDFLVENPIMERDFYMQLSEAYKLTDNNAKAKAFAIKAQAIKEQK